MLCPRLNLRKFLVAFLFLALSLGVGSPSTLAAEHVIQPDDILSIVVNGEPTLTKEYTVNANGDIQMDLIGKSHVGGLTLDKAQSQITQQLKKYLKLYDVKVALAGDSGVKVLVFGEVVKPGPVRLGINGKLLDALSEAGGLKADADPKRISVLRKAATHPDHYDLDAISQDRKLNIILGSGDTITVPPKASYTVLIDGEVRQNGARSLDSAKTLLAAIMAAGPSEHADWSRVLVRRKGAPQAETVDLTQVRAGAAPDTVELHPGDQITVLSRILGTAKIIGEVKTPGEKQLTGKTFVMDFIGTAGGGFTEKADQRRVEIRRAGKEPVKADITAMLQGEKDAADPELEILPGDTVFVPNGEKTRFNIVGGVNKGGPYPVQPGMNLIDAITVAEGFKQTASRKTFVIAPVDPNDERLKINNGDKRKPKKGEEAAQGLIVIDYKKLLKGDASQNVPIKSGDRILIPEEEVNTRTRTNPLEWALRILPFIGIF